jgi:hypothetical protein
MIEAKRKSESEFLARAKLEYLWFALALLFVTLLVRITSHT